MKKILIYLTLFSAIHYTQCYIVTIKNETKYDVQVDIQSAVNTQTVIVPQYKYREANTSIICPWRITVSNSNPGSEKRPMPISVDYPLMEHCAGKDITITSDSSGNFIISSALNGARKG